MENSTSVSASTIRAEDHLGIVWCLAKKFVRRGNIEDSEIYSVGCLALVEAVKTFDPSRSKFCTWAWQIVRNRMLDEVKKSSRSKEKSSPDLASTPDEREKPMPVHILPEILSNFGGRENQEDAKMLIGYYLEGRSLSELGREFGFSKEWIRKRMQVTVCRIREKNRHVLEGYL